MADTLHLMRETPCSICLYPLIQEWTCLWGPEGGRHVYCVEAGDWREMERAWPFLGVDDRAWLGG